MKLSNTYLGFTNNIKPMQAAKKEATLDKLMRYEGVVMSEKEFILTLVKSGYSPMIKYGYSYYSRKLEGMTKPKDQPILKNAEGSSYTISKTSYEFALHIIDNNFTDNATLIKFIQNEQDEKKRTEAERIRIEKEEKELQEQQRQEAETKRKQELEQKRQAWKENGKQYMTNEVKLIIISLIDSNWSEIAERFPTTDKETLTNELTETFTMYLGNHKGIEGELYYFQNTDLEITIQNNPSMFLRKSFLQTVFNIQPEDNTRTLNSKIKAFYTGKEYKETVRKEKQLETVYVFENQSKTFTETVGEKHNIEGFTCYLIKEGENYRMIESKSGLGVNGKFTNKAECIKKAKDVIQSKKEIMNRSIEAAVNKFGISPLYQEAI